LCSRLLNNWTALSKCTVKPPAYSVLVVEDERIVAKDLQQTLQGLGYDAFAIASSAEEAMARASERCPDVVLMDVRIKGPLDGIETAKMMRARFGVPIIYLTAHADIAIIERAKATDPQGYLLKPVKSAELLSAIEVSRYRHDLSQRLREAEERFRLAIDEAPIGMALVRLDGLFLRVNHALCRIVGYSSDELTALTFQAITHPDDLEANVALAGQVARGEIPKYQLAKRYIRKDGSVVDVMVSVSVVRERSGEPLYYVAQMEDISERKKAERELLRLHEQVARQAEIYRTIVRHLPNGAVFMIDRELRYLSADGPAIRDILQFAKLRPDQIVGSKVEDVVSDGNRESVLAIYREALRGKAQHFEIQRGEHSYDVDAAPLVGTSGDVMGALVFCYDVTERKRLFEELARKNAVVQATAGEIEAVLGAIPDPILIRVGALCAYANAALAQALAYETPDELIGRPCLDLIHADDRPSAAGRIAQFASDGVNETTEVRFLTKDGATVLLDIRPSRRVTYKGQPAGLVILHDTHERKRLEAMLPRHEDRLHRGLAATARGPLQSVLFLCSGNYYRSRFAEAIFNHRAAVAGLRWTATSAGLRPDHFALNSGPISPIVVEALSLRGIVVSEPRGPIAVREADFAAADCIVAMKEAEHRPLIAVSFPSWTERVVYWNVHDIEDAAPADTLQEIERRVEALFASPPIIASMRMKV
jgi:PAS domain S-box-containing protein